MTVGGRSGWGKRNDNANCNMFGVMERRESERESEREGMREGGVRRVGRKRQREEETEGGGANDREKGGGAGG